MPDNLRYEQIDPEADLPDSADEVELYVLPYRFRPSRRRARWPQLPKLKVVQTLSAGVEHIAGYVPDGVLLCNGRGIHDTSTAELDAGPDPGQPARDPRFRPRPGPGDSGRRRRGESLADKQVLIVGYGQIGAAIEERHPSLRGRGRPGRADGPGTAYTAIHELPDLLPDADVVVLIVPGTTETSGLFDAAMLARMKDGALLVNVSRGAVVDTDALLVELERGASTQPSTSSTPSRCPGTTRCGGAPTCCSCRTSAATAARCGHGPTQLVREQLHRFATGEPLANVMSGDY